MASPQDNYIEINSRTINNFLIPASLLFSALIISTSLFLGINGLKGKTPEEVCSPDNPLSEACLLQYAEELDLNKRKFASCIEDEKYNEKIDKEIEAGTELGVSGTPSLFIAKESDDKITGFFIELTGEPESLIDLIEFARDNNIEETNKYYLDKQRAGLDAYRKLVNDFYTSDQGGKLTGTDLTTKVEETMAQRSAYIEESFPVRELSLGDAQIEGKGDVILMEFSDFECPYCKQFYTDVLVKIKEEFIANDKIRFAFRDYPLESIHPNAKLSAVAARCAGEQKKYFEFHDKLFSL